MIQGYLLDNNALYKLFKKHPKVEARAKAVGGSLIFISVINQGELSWGHKITVSTNPVLRTQYENWVKQTFPGPINPLQIIADTIDIYGDIRAELFRKFGPKSKKANHPEDCYDRVTGKELGIDENDLWQAAIAMAHDLTFVSNDRMKNIKTAAGAALKWEDWEV